MGSLKSEGNPEISCADILQFQNALKRMRNIDDKIVYELNEAIPTTSFKNKLNATTECQRLYESLHAAYKNREKSIKKCIADTQKMLNELRSQKAQNLENTENNRRLRHEETKLRMIQSELGVEEVLRNQSLKVIYERCRDVYKPPPELIVAPVHQILR